MQIGRREDAAAFVQPLPLMPVAAGIRQPKTHTEQFANSLLCSPTSLPAWKNVVPCAALLRWTENPCAHNINFKFPLSHVNEPPATTILHAQTLVSRFSFSRSNLQHVGATRHTVSALFRLLRLTVPLLFLCPILVLSPFARSTP